MTNFIDLLVSFISGIFNLFAEMYKLIFTERAKKYEADFTLARELLKRSNTGWLIGNKYAITREKSFEGFFLSSQPGAGKTSGFVIGSLIHISGNCTVICLDPSMECFHKTAAYYTKLGYTVLTLNFSDKDGSKSDGWNPFPKDMNEVAGFFSTLCSLSLGANEKDPFWRLSAASLLSTLGSLLFSFDMQYRTMANVNYLLHLLASAKSKKVDMLMSKYADEGVWLEYSGFYRNSDNVKGSIIATAKAALDIFNQEGIKRITSYSSIDMSKLRREKTIIYVQTSAAELVKYQVLISLFFDHLITHLLRSMPKDDDLDVFICMEEGGIYMIPSAPILFTQGRKYRVAPAMICQSQSQLFNRYAREDAETILNSCYSKLYLSNTELTTAKEISEISGQFSYKDENGHYRLAPLLTPDEVKSIPPGMGLLLHGHHKPVLLKNIVPYYKDRKLTAITSMQEPELHRKLPEGPVPLLPVDDLFGTVKKKAKDGK